MKYLNSTGITRFWNNIKSYVTSKIPTKVSELDNDLEFLTSVPNLDASKITSGTIDIARLPQGALERLSIVADESARFALTSSNVQVGDVVKQSDTGVMYMVVDESNLNNSAGYVEFTAGTATSVPWSGVSSKPETFTPSSHTHTVSEVTDFPSNLVTTNTDQTVGGNKTFSSPVTLSYNLVFKTTSTRGTAPASNVYRSLADYKDSASNRISLIESAYNSDASSETRIYAYKTTEASGNNIGRLGIGCDSTGNVYTVAPTPATSDNSTQIATTAYVKSQGYATTSDIPTNVSSLTNDSNYIRLANPTNTMFLDWANQYTGKVGILVDNTWLGGILTTENTDVSNFVTLDGTQTISGAKTFSNNQEINGMFKLKTTTDVVEQFRQVLPKDVTVSTDPMARWDTLIDSVGHYVAIETKGHWSSYALWSMQLKYQNDKTGTINFRLDSTGSGLFYPESPFLCSLGNLTNPWNNTYTNKLYLNGSEFGLGVNNTWTGINTFPSVTIKDTTALSNGDYGGVLTYRDNQGNRHGYIQPYKDTSGTVNLVVGSDNGNVQLDSNTIPYTNNTISLGSSTNQWQHLHVQNTHTDFVEPTMSNTGLVVRATDNTWENGSRIFLYSNTHPSQTYGTIYIDVDHGDGNNTKTALFLTPNEFIPGGGGSIGVNLGSSTNQWTKIYGQTYYYNGTQWGLDQYNVWTGWNIYRNHALVIKDTRIPNTTAPESDTLKGVFDVWNDDNHYWGGLAYRWCANGNSELVIALSNWINNVQGYWEYKIGADKSGNQYFTPPHNLVNLGTSSNRWRSVYADSYYYGTTAFGNIVTHNTSEFATASHTHGNSDITGIDASKITSGTIDIARLPQGALQRLVTVNDQTARYALTSNDVSLGDTVKQIDNGELYIITDTSNLNNSNGYTNYTAGTATQSLADGSGNIIETTYGKLSSGVNVWSNQNNFNYDTFFKNGIYIRNIDYEVGTTPANNVALTVNNVLNSNKSIGYSRSVVYSNSSNTSYEIVAQNKFTNGALDPNGSYESSSFSVVVESNGNKYTTWNGNVKNSIIPYSNSAYTLGTSNYRWSSVYADSYYYGTTAWGLDKANVWTNAQIIEQSTVAQFKLKNSAMSLGDAVPSGLKTVGSVAFTGSDNYNFGFMDCRDSALGNTFVRILARQKYDDNGNRSASGTTYESGLDIGVLNDTTPYVAPVYNSVTHLGTSTNKWKTINGLNPGALSLPQAGASTVISVDITEWYVQDPAYPDDPSELILDGTEHIVTALLPGWVRVTFPNVAGNYAYARQFQAGANMASEKIATGISELNYLNFIFPIHDRLVVKIKAKSASVNIYPCMGNV